MKYLLSLFLLALVSCAQNFVRTGTGLSGVSYQWKLAGMKSGCLFMAACCIGGLGTDAQMLSARAWAVKKGYIRDSDTYCNINSLTLAQYISKNYGTPFHSTWKTKQGCGHFWVVDANGKEVFNAAGLGYTGC
jgi:hypothetical protein